MRQIFHWLALLLGIILCGSQAAGLSGKAQAFKQGVYTRLEPFQFARQLGHIYIVVIPFGVAAFKFRSYGIERSARRRASHKG